MDTPATKCYSRDGPTDGGALQASSLVMRGLPQGFEGRMGGWVKGKKREEDDVLQIPGMFQRQTDWHYRAVVVQYAATSRPASASRTATEY